MQLWLGLIPAHVVVAAIIGHWILLPLVQRTGILTSPTRFTLVDVLCLMALIQVVLACFIPVLSFDDLIWVFWLPLLVAALLCTVLMWASSVSLASQAGITRPLRRTVLILVLIPGTLVMMNVVPLAIGAATGWFAGEIQQLLQLPKSIPVPFAAIYGAALVPLLALTLLLHFLASWVLKFSEPPRLTSADIDVPLPESLEEQHGGGGGEVEAIDGAEEREADRTDIFAPPKI